MIRLATINSRTKARWRRHFEWLPVIAALAGAPCHSRADTILGSKHDLSIAGGGTIKAATESEVCLFCHIPHRGTGEQPLWSHTLSTATYTPYGSSTAKATIGQPTGSSKLCLSCHDGTVALGMIKNRPSPIRMRNEVVTMPPGRSNLGTDLSDDHPISFVYDSALAGANGQLRDPGSLTDKVRLDHNSHLQCTSCHDPHSNRYGKFLVKDNTASALCVTCHSISSWQGSSHATSAKTWNGTGIDPWPNSEHASVSANGCESCHAPHNAGTRPRLLTFADEEQNCLSCHSGTVASKDIAADFNKLSVHPIRSTTGVHDPMENPFAAGPRHVECADCHNSHAVTGTPASAPNASGALAGLAGINEQGAIVRPLTKEYELCFNCHGPGPTRGQAKVPRQFPETDTSLEFRTANMSFHPVIGTGKNPNVPSLIAPWTEASFMYCTDCHNSDTGPRAGGTGANGPHGSAFEPLLEKNLLTADFQPENITAYELCYKCHSRDSILANQSFPYHSQHIVEEQTACTTCHDPHGVSNVPHLINFNTTYVTNFNGALRYTSLGAGHGTCTLTCHGEAHNNVSY